MNDDHRKHKNLSDTKKGEKKDPKADDSKQSYMERQLSISKHEEVLLKESREDSQCKKKLLKLYANQTDHCTVYAAKSHCLLQDLTRSTEIFGNVVL